MGMVSFPRGWKKESEFLMCKLQIHMQYTGLQYARGIKMPYGMTGKRMSKKLIEWKGK